MATPSVDNILGICEFSYSVGEHTNGQKFFGRQFDNIQQKPKTQNFDTIIPLLDIDVQGCKQKFGNKNIYHIFILAKDCKVPKSLTLENRLKIWYLLPIKPSKIKL